MELYTEYIVARDGAWQIFPVADVCCNVCGVCRVKIVTVQKVKAALRIDAFTPLDEFKALMDGMAAHLKATPLAPGVDRIQLAGDPEHEMEERRRAEGIPLHPIVIDSLSKMCEELEIEFDI